MQMNPHLSFNGQCEAAFKFYEICFGAKIVAMLAYGDSPMAEQVGSDWRKKIIHVTLALGENRLTGGDVPPQSYQKPQGISVLLNVDGSMEAQRIFKALAEGGLCNWPSRKPSGRVGLGWSPTNLARRG